MLPNLLTIARLASLPVIIGLFTNDRCFAAAAVFVAAMLTDCVDGWIARRFNQATPLGVYLDPVVDKIVVLSMLYALAFRHVIHPALPHLFLARELLQNALRCAAAAKGSVVGANWMGKTKLVLQTILIAWGLIVAGASGLLPACACYFLNSALRAYAWTTLAVTWSFFALFASQRAAQSRPPRTAARGPGHP